MMGKNKGAYTSEKYSKKLLTASYKDNYRKEQN